MAKNNKKSSIGSLIVVIAIVLLIPVMIVLLMALSEHHIMIVNDNFNNMKDSQIKEVIEKEYKMQKNPYIRVITYQQGFSDGYIYKVCVYYKNKRDCRKSSAPLGEED